LPFAKAVALMQEAEAILSAHRDKVSTEHVLQLVSSSQCNAYDCEFVAVAQHLGVPLITEDRAILTAFPDLAQSLHQATS
jgi:predicted nucleic acid-binding protein